MIINKNKKKKGFTLIELIAVIAILAILGAILVPRIGGYSAKANKSKDLANAKGLLQAVEMYNQDNQTEQIGPEFVAGEVTETTIDKDKLSTYGTWPADPKTVTASIDSGDLEWEDMTYSNLKTYAEELEEE